jgi:aliphatic nitrilase
MGDSVMRLAAVQAAPVFLNRDATVEKACALIREAGRQGARVIGFPEGFIPAHPYWFHFFPAVGPLATDYAERLFNNAVEIPGPEIDALCDAAREANAYVVMGACERSRASQGTLYNSQVFIDWHGRLLGKHQKLVPTHAERVVHAPGSKPYAISCFDTELGGRLGGLICGEHFNPLARFALMAKGELIHVGSWPANFAAGSQKEMFEAKNFIGRAHAFEGKLFVISAAGVLTDEIKAALTAGGISGEVVQSRGGGSAIISPGGSYLAGPAPDDEEVILYADVDVSRAVRGKLMHDVAGHYQRADVFQLTLDARDTPLLVESVPSTRGLQITELAPEAALPQYVATHTPPPLSAGSPRDQTL